MKNMMKNYLRTTLVLLALVAVCNVRVMAQGGTAINNTGNAADPAAMLDVSAADKGVLVPRVLLISTVDPIAGTKPDGLLVWNASTSGTYSTPGYYYWNGTDWQMLGAGDNLGNHTATQALDMNSNLVMNVSDPVAPEDAVNASTVQKGNLIFGLASGTDNYTMSLNPVISAYSTGMVINFLAANACTGAVTLNVNGLGVVSVLKNSNLALIANDIKSGQVVSVIFDGTNFQMVSQLGNATTGGGGSYDPTLIYTTDGF